MEPLSKWTNHWYDYEAISPAIACTDDPEYCHNCGRQLVESIELTGMRSTRTGLPTYARWHSCPTWVEGWRTMRFVRFWMTPGMGHDNHDADNPMSARGYR